MFKVKAVLPIAGRAATRIRSDRCNPFNLKSKSLNPVGTPVIDPLMLLQFVQSINIRKDYIPDW